MRRVELPSLVYKTSALTVELHPNKVNDFNHFPQSQALLSLHSRTPWGLLFWSNSPELLEIAWFLLTDTIISVKQPMQPALSTSLRTLGWYYSLINSQLSFVLSFILCIYYNKNFIKYQLNHYFFISKKLICI